METQAAITNAHEKMRVLKKRQAKREAKAESAKNPQEGK